MFPFKLTEWVEKKLSTFFQQIGFVKVLKNEFNKPKCYKIILYAC